MSSPAAAPAATRDRLIAAMLDALRTRGYHGVGLTELLAAADAPKGVLYHHFPGGKAELAVRTVEAVIATLSSDLDKLLARAPDPADALSLWMNSALRLLEASGFQRGCPLATIGLESTPDDVAIRQALAAGFTQLRVRLGAALGGTGLDADDARRYAALIVSAYEGALLQARVAGDAQSMRDTLDALASLLRLRISAARPVS